MIGSRESRGEGGGEGEEPSIEAAICGAGNQRVVRALVAALRSPCSSCLTLDGPPGSGKTLATDLAFRAAACEVVRWDEEASCGGVAPRPKTFSPLARSTGVLAYLPTDDPLPPPLVVLADNVHDIFAETRAGVQLLVRKADALKRSGPRHRRPVHLVVTLDSTRLEARIEAQVKGLASSPPPSSPTSSGTPSMQWPSPPETLAFVEAALRAEDPRVRALPPAALSPVLMRVDASRGVRSAMEQAAALLSPSDEGCARMTPSTREGDDEGGLPMHYTGFKADSLMTCLRESRLSLAGRGDVDTAERVAASLLLANAMVLGLKGGTEHGDAEVRKAAAALHAQAARCCWSSPPGPH